MEESCQVMIDAVAAFGTANAQDAIQIVTKLCSTFIASLKSLKGRAKSLTPGMPKKVVLLPKANTSQSYCKRCPSASVIVPPEHKQQYLLDLP